jgi:hypothetical protein
LDDTLILANGKEVILQSIKEKVADPGTQLYNFILEGNNTYYANGYLVHNKGSPTDPQPSIPEFTCLKYKDGFVIARWRCASYASGYEFQFIYASEKIYYEDFNIKFQTLEISFGVNGSLPAGKYTGKLRSKHGTDKQSDWAVKPLQNSLHQQ